MLLPAFGDGRGRKLLLPAPTAASPCLVDSSTDSADPAPPSSSPASNSTAACTAAVAAAAAEPAEAPRPLPPPPPPVDELRLPNLEEAARAGAAKRDEGADATAGTAAFRGIPVRGSRLGPPVASSTAVAADLTAAAAAAAALARLAASPLPPMVARWSSRRSPPADGAKDDALRGDTAFSRWGEAW